VGLSDSRALTYVLHTTPSGTASDDKENRRRSSGDKYHQNDDHYFDRDWILWPKDCNEWRDITSIKYEAMHNSSIYRTVRSPSLPSWTTWSTATTERADLITGRAIARTYPMGQVG